MIVVGLLKGACAWGGPFPLKPSHQKQVGIERPYADIDRYRIGTAVAVLDGDSEAVASDKALIRKYSLNGVPLGSKNGSGAIIRIFMKSQD